MEHGSNGEEEHALVAPEVADDGVEAGFVRTQGPQDAEIEDLEIDEGFAARTRFDGGIGLCENALDITGDVTGEAKDKLKGFLGNPRVVIFQPLLNPFSKNVAIWRPLSNSMSVWISSKKTIRGTRSWAIRSISPKSCSRSVWSLRASL